MLSGRCLCGGVQYEIDGPLRSMYHCHCSICRRASGSSFATNAVIAKADFSVVAGQDLISNFGSSAGIRRHFCSRCGSPLYASVDQSPNILSLRCGTLDADPHTRPTFHIYVKSRAPWYDISDQLLQLDERGSPEEVQRLFFPVA